MITLQHKETEKGGVFEAWMRATEEGACTEPVQVGEIIYQRPIPERMIIDHTRVYDGFEGRGIAQQMVLAAVNFARALLRLWLIGSQERRTMTAMTRVCHPLWISL